MFKHIAGSVLCLLIAAGAYAQTYTYKASTKTDSVAVGEVFEVTYTLVAPTTEIDVLVYDFGANHCKGLSKTGATSRNEEMTTNNGKTSHTIAQTIGFTALTSGTIEIPRGYVINSSRDTIWSNALTLNVVNGLKKELFPVLKNEDLFQQPSDNTTFNNPFFAEVGFVKKSGIEEAARETKYPYLINAGIAYHRVVVDSERTAAIAVINHLGAEIVGYLKSQKNCEPIGLFVQAHEPRYVFAIQDTGNIRQGLHTIYARYKNMVCNTTIGSKDAKEEIADFIIARNLWEQADWQVRKLEASNDPQDMPRKIFVTITFSTDSAMNEYSRWAIGNGYSIFKTGERQRLSHTRFSTNVTYAITSSAQLPDLYNVAALHRKQCLLWENCRYQRIEVEETKK